MSAYYQSGCTDPQIEFLELKCKYPAFVAGYGTGKSQTLIERADMDAWIGGGDAWVTIYAPTHGLLHKIIVPRIEERLQSKGIQYRHNKQMHEIITDRDDYGNFRFVSLDNPGTIVGYEDFRAHVDELDTLPTDTAEDIWIKIQARNRQVPKKLKYKVLMDEEGNEVLENGEPVNRICAYTTPEGYKFTYRMWEEKKEELGHLFQMIQGSTRSNPFLPKDFINTLEQTYPSEKLKAYLNGEFCNLNSGTVYNHYHPEDCNSNEVIRGCEDLHIGMDFNKGNMSGVVFVKRTQIINNRETIIWHAVDELVNRISDNKPIDDTQDIIDEIKSRYQSKGHQIYIYPDQKSGNAGNVNAPRTSVQMLREAGFKIRARSQANPNIKNRVDTVNKAFEVKRVLVNRERCRRTSDCLIMQPWDDKTDKPCKKTGFDHMNDAFGYFVYYHLPIQERTYSVKSSFRQ